MANVLDKFKTELSNKFSEYNLSNKDQGINAYQDFVNAVKEDTEIDEKWSQKYKDSIDCKHPKGFSQRAHCQGKKKKSENKEATGAASAGQFSAPLFGKIKKKESKKSETKEATGASSAGQYSTPAMWAKSTNKKDWRGAKKTQIPGGKFVTVKKKCKTFPYCNQGDINALKIYENKLVKEIISKISKEHNISENVIKAVIQNELENNKINKK
jgi:hypothetical protein